MFMSQTSGFAGKEMVCPLFLFVAARILEFYYREGIFITAVTQRN